MQLKKWHLILCNDDIDFIYLFFFYNFTFIYFFCTLFNISHFYMMYVMLLLIIYLQNKRKKCSLWLTNVIYILLFFYFRVFSFKKGGVKFLVCILCHEKYSNCFLCFEVFTSCCKSSVNFTVDFFFWFYSFNVKRYLILFQLNSTKSVDHKTTLLHYIVDIIEKKHPDALNFAEELMHIDRAARGYC